MMKNYWTYGLPFLVGAIFLLSMASRKSTPLANQANRSASLPAEVWKVDAAHSEVLFSLMHLDISRVTGRFHDFDVTLASNERQLNGASVSFVAQVKSIDTAHPIRDKNLREQSYFFEADRYPTLSFTEGTLRQINEEQYRMEGNFTMKGITRPLSLDVLYHGQQPNEEGVPHIGFTATGKLSRKAFGMDQTPVVENTPLLSDSVELIIHLDLLPKAHFREASSTSASSSDKDSSPDMIQIVNMANKFSDAANRADSEMFASLWAEEGRWIIEPPIDQQFTGRETIRRALPQMLSTWDFFVQQSPNGVVTVRGDTAYARFYVNETARNKDGTGHYNLGMYEDKLICEEGAWKFWERHYHYLYLDERDQPGQAFPVPELPKPHISP